MAIELADESLANKDTKSDSLRIHLLVILQRSKHLAQLLQTVFIHPKTIISHLEY